MRWYKDFRFIFFAIWSTGLDYLLRACVDLMRARGDGPSEGERLRRGSECLSSDCSERWWSIIGESTASLFTAILLLVVLERFG